ncbi:MAG: cadmium-translocating P-type ATPase [Prevotella sp.]|nr:cadmium-translocating P-type ATPase [Prevotella sp.]
MKRSIMQIAAAALLLVAAVLTEHYSSLPTWQLLLIYLVPYLIVGYETLHEALEGLAHGEAFNEHLLMSVATIGALAIGFMPGAETEFPEAVFVMLFFQVGELFESYAEGRSRRSISHLMDIRPDQAHVVRNGKEVTVAPDTIVPGETIVVKSGEKIPLDGIVTSGSSTVNTVALTGESMPRQAAEGDEVLSGCVNLSGLLHIRVTKAFGDSTATKIIELVESAGEHKSRSERFISRFARIYTPVVVFAALALAVAPPLLAYIINNVSVGEAMSIFTLWLHRALIFLVVSCPCALVISVPLTFFGGIGRASRHGILIKGANYIDTLAKIKTVVFDKTGTLTQGHFAVTAVHPERYDEQHLLHLAAHVEHFSTHPIGAALREAFPEEATDGCQVTDVVETAGHGISARIGSDLVCVGNTKMMERIGAHWHDCHHSGTIIHVAINGEYAGHIVITDQPKADSQQAVSSLHELGVEKVVMLTGDRNETGRDIAQQLGIDEYHAELLPAEKVKHVESLLTSGTPDGKLAFVGDGINDAPVLARADVGIAMGAIGSDAAIEAADVVLMDDKPSKICTAIRLARRTLAIARQNVWFAIGVKLAVLILASIGLSTMWMAVFADVGVTVLAVLNAMRN